MTERKTERNEDIYNRYLSGETYKQIGQDYGLAVSSVRQVVQEVSKRKWFETTSDPVIAAGRRLGMSQNAVMRTYKSLERLGYLRTWPYMSDEELLNISGFGERAMMIMREARRGLHEKD